MTTNTMLAQIHSLPHRLRQALPTFDRAARETLDHNLCLAARRLFLAGCGDSHHAALAAELAFELQRRHQSGRPGAYWCTNEIVAAIGY
jgi:fructoselysine-6-P-deglycase FrlB-like protein